MLAVSIMHGSHRLALPVFFTILAAAIVLIIVAPILSRIRDALASKSDPRPPRTSAQREARLDLESRHKEL
jgi:hypothetical protein